MTIHPQHKFHAHHGFTGSAGNDCNKMCMSHGGRIKVTKKNVVRVVEKHVNESASKAHHK